MAPPKWEFRNGQFSLSKPQGGPPGGGGIPGFGDSKVYPSGPAHKFVGNQNILEWMEERYAAIDAYYATYAEENPGMQLPESYIETQQAIVNSTVEMYNKEVSDAGDKADMKTIADAKIAQDALDWTRSQTNNGKAAANAEALRVKIAAEQKVAAEETRKRGIAGSEAAAVSYETAGTKAHSSAMETIKKMYGELDEQNAGLLKDALSQLGVDVETAKTDVSKAGSDFLSGYNPSKAYETAPVVQESVGANPLLDSLRSQGADTASVTAATADSNATLQQFAAFQKWANENLNTGQQNFDTGMKNTSSLATTAGLQNIARKQPVIASGIKTDYAGYQNTINEGRAAAKTAADAGMAASQGLADEARANALINYGPVPAKGSMVANNDTAKDAPITYPNFQVALQALHPNRPKQSLAKDKVKFSKLFASFKKA